MTHGLDPGRVWSTFVLGSIELVPMGVAHSLLLHMLLPESLASTGTDGWSHRPKSRCNPYSTADRHRNSWLRYSFGSRLRTPKTRILLRQLWTTQNSFIGFTRNIAIPGSMCQECGRLNRVSFVYFRRPAIHTAE